MKKIFSLFVASVMAMSLFAGELTLDLNTAQGYTSEGGSCTPVVAEGVLNASWTVAKAWDVAGVEFVLPDLTGVTKINFDLKGDGQDVTLYVYLVDANGGLKWEAEHWISLSSTDWASLEITPNADLWGNHGEEPWKKLVIVANPGGEIVSGAFSIRDLKITCDYEPVVAKPETAPAAPAHAEEDVMALYCNHYTTNNLHFTPQSWSGIAWETLSLDGTDVAYTAAMTWDGFKGATDSVDLSGYSKLHFDIWAPDTLLIDLTIEAKAGFKHGIQFRLNAGWNTIDADPAWWNYEEITYDWKNVKCIIFEHYMHRDSTSAEGSPLAVANVYFWNEPTPDYPEAPADPTIAEEKVTALFAQKYQTNTLAFAPTSWGASWSSPAGYETSYFYTAAFGWDAFTNWDEPQYDLSAYDMFACDIWVELDSKIKISFECRKPSDGGTREWKQGTHFELKANQWNHVEVDLLNAPYTVDDYDFSDMRYFLLDAFQKPDGSSAEGTPVGVTNAYFFNSMDQAVEHVEAGKTAVKRLIDGKLVIEKNGVRYNAQGTRF